MKKDKLKNFILKQKLLGMNWDIDYDKNAVTGANFDRYIDSVELPPVENVGGRTDGIYGTFMRNLKAGEIIIPDTVKYIHIATFQNNEYIKRIVMSKNTKIIDEYAFNYCGKLEEVDWNGCNPLYIDANAFNVTEYSTNLIIKAVNAQCNTGGIISGNTLIVAVGPAGKYKVPENVKNVVETAFRHIMQCGINRIEFNDNIEYLPDRIFGHSANSQIIDIKLPKNLKNIPREAFTGIRNINNTIDIPETVEVIGEFAFLYSSFKELTIPKSVKYIASNAFTGMVQLKKLNIPKNVKIVQSGKITEIRDDMPIAFEEYKGNHNNLEDLIKENLLHLKERKEVNYIQICDKSLLDEIKVERFDTMGGIINWY